MLPTEECRYPPIAPVLEVRCAIMGSKRGWSCLVRMGSGLIQYAGELVEFVEVEFQVSGEMEDLKGRWQRPLTKTGYLSAGVGQQDTPCCPAVNDGDRRYDRLRLARRAIVGVAWGVCRCRLINE